MWSYTLKGKRQWKRHERKLEITFFINPVNKKRLHGLPLIAEEKGNGK